jgi:cell fate (sporulation/competence/biofilm development) regulator YlbF (YheA/YmcA/DUF963 family)
LILRLRSDHNQNHSNGFQEAARRAWPARAENHGPNRVKDKDESKKVSEQFNKVRERLMEAQKESGADYETHGWVWLFLRKPAIKTMEGVR